MLPAPRCDIPMRSVRRGAESNMNIAAILVVTWIVQGESGSSKQFDFPTLALCEAARGMLQQEHERAARKDPTVPELVATCSGFADLR